MTSRKKAPIFPDSLYVTRNAERPDEIYYISYVDLDESVEDGQTVAIYKLDQVKRAKVTRELT